MKKFYLILFLVSMLCAHVARSQNYTAGFDTAPDYTCSKSGDPRNPECFQVTINGVIYVFSFTSDGGGGSFLHVPKGGINDGPSMDLESKVIDYSTGEKVTITRLDGGTFSFSSIYVDNLGSVSLPAGGPVTVQPFLGSVPAASAQAVTEGGKQTLSFGGVTTSSIQITSNDFYYVSLDNFTICVPHSIVSGPSGGTICVGSPFSLGVSTTGTGLSYQWKKNGTDIPGATGNSYNITSAGTGDAGSYTVQVTSTCGTPLTSSAAVINVNQAPSITSQPENETVCQAGSASFSVTASNAVSYQWQVNTGSGFVNVPSLSMYSGDNTANLTIIGVTPAMNGYQYRVIAMGSCSQGAISNIVTLGVTNLTLITSAPVGATKCAGEPVSFSVAATGSNLSYQWKKNSSNIAGATSSTYTIASASVADAGTYSVEVSGECGAPIVADGAVLVMNEAPTITSQPGSVGICTGGNASFGVAANNTTGYKWQVNAGSGFTNIANGGVYSGATTATLGITGAPASMNGYQYRAVATGHCTPAATSNTVTLNLSIPTALGEFTPVTPVLINTAASMSIAFTGGAPATAVWNWGDGTTSNGVVVGSTITGSRVYALQGVYTPTLTVTSCGTSVSKSYQYLVVYDPNGGFMTGNGWFNSPAGAYRPQPSLEGRVNFGFVSKYKRGTTIPDGNTQFQYRLGDMTFLSTTYEWLVISGSKGQFKGSGTINGIGRYGFILTAIDGDKRPDRLRMKIWDNSTGVEVVVYDNQFGASNTADPTTIIGSGSIVVQKANKNARKMYDPTDEEALSSGLLRGYPNPVADKLTIDLDGMASMSVTGTEVVDAAGKTVLLNSHRVTGDSKLEIDMSVIKAGFYLLKVQASSDVKLLKIIKQ